MINEIDVTRPQDYQTRDGRGEVLFMVFNENTIAEYQLLAIIKTSKAIYASHFYKNGQCKLYKEDASDIIPRTQAQEENVIFGKKEELDKEMAKAYSKDQQEAQPEAKKRKVVQITATISNQGETVYALRDDGKIFCNWNRNDWVEYPAIPQD